MTIYDNEGLHKGDEFAMRTFTGRKINPYTMKPEDVALDDIVHPLSRQCRFNGHTTGHLSVARHSINVHDWLVHHHASAEECLAGLLHDAAEAYIGDMIRPIKKRPEFKEFTSLDIRVTAVILTAFQLPDNALPAIVHEADIAMGRVEVDYLRFVHDTTPEQDAAAFAAVLKTYWSIHRKDAE